MPEATVLLADDEDTLRENLAQVLQEEGFGVIACPDGSAALRALRNNDVKAIITDLRIPGVTGMELIDHAAKLAPDALVIIITAFGEVETAVEAMKKGALDYICKPVILDEVVFKLKRLLAQNGLERENKQLRAQIRQVHHKPDVIGDSAAMKRAIKLLDDVNRDYPIQPSEADEALILKAEILSRLGRERDAEAAYLTVLQQYPQTPIWSSRALKHVLDRKIAGIEDRRLEDKVQALLDNMFSKGLIVLKVLFTVCFL